MKKTFGGDLLNDPLIKDMIEGYIDQSKIPSDSPNHLVRGKSFHVLFPIKEFQAIDADGVRGNVGDEGSSGVGPDKLLLINQIIIVKAYFFAIFVTQVLDKTKVNDNEIFKGDLGIGRFEEHNVLEFKVEIVDSELLFQIDGCYAHLAHNIEGKSDAKWRDFEVA
jgi:hypothetical protein